MHKHNYAVIMTCSPPLFKFFLAGHRSKIEQTTCVQLRSWVQKVIKIKVVVFYFKLYKYIV